MQQQSQLSVVRQKVPTFSDGTDAPLKHAPRRKSAPDPTSVPAKLPEHWKKKTFVAAGSKNKIKEVEDPIPDFDMWRKHHRRKDVRVIARGEVPSMPEPVPSSRIPSKNEEVTPMPFGGDMTPAPDLFGETPRMPPADTPRMPGVETPGFGAETPGFGAETPGFGGDETPRVPWSKGEATPMLGMGDATPPQLPTCPTRAVLSKMKEGTPQMSEFGTPQVPDMGTPQVTDMGTPQVPHGQETPFPEYMPGMETPMMPPPLHAPYDGPATPPRGGGAAAAVDMTPLLGGVTPLLGGARHAQIKPGTVAL